MTAGISRVDAVHVGLGAAAAAKADAAEAKNAAPATPEAKAHATKERDLAKAAHEFEAIFVRSMLKESGIAGKSGSYGDFAVDALAQSVTAGKGLGLGELVKRAVEKNETALKVSK